MVLQVPLLLCPIFGPMIDCWHRVKLEMLFAVIVLLNTCMVFITKVILHWFFHLRIYDPNQPQKQFHLDIPLYFTASIEGVFNSALGFRNGNVSFYCLQISTVGIFRCLSLS